MVEPRRAHEPQREIRPPRPLPGGRKVLVSIGIGAAVAAGLYAVIGEISGYGDLRQALGRVHPFWFVMATAGQAIAYAGYALGYRGTAAARRGPRLGYPTALRVVVLGFGGHVVGGASAGGLAVSVWALRRAGETLRDAVRRAIAIATLEWLVLGAATVAASAFLLARGSGTVPRAMTVGWIVAVSTAIALGTALTSGGRGPRRAGAARGRVLAALGAALATGLDATRLVRGIVSRPLRHRDAICGFAAYWSGDLLTLYAGLRAFDVRLSLAVLVLAYATGYVVASAPLPLGAVGAAEASLTAALAAVGVALAPAALGVLVYRFCTFWLPLLPALATLPSLRRLAADLDAVRLARGAPTVPVVATPGPR